MTISLATGCMNRASVLRWTLPSWLYGTDVDEIVIVDWGSAIPIHEELKDFTDSRIRHIRVEGQSYWCAARCHNVEICAATGDNLLRIDSDILLNPRFFGQHPLQDDLFWNASWKDSLGDDCHLYGTVYTKRKNFFLVNGYNEHLQSYGFEDEDIYQRMLNAGLQRRSANRLLMKHFPHDMPSRLCHLDPEFKVEVAIEGVGKNLKISQEHPWTVGSDRMSKWNIMQAASNLWIYTPDT